MSEQGEQRKRVIKVLSNYGLESSRDEWVADLITDLMRAVKMTK